MKNIKEGCQILRKEYLQFKIGIVAIALTLTTVSHQIKKGGRKMNNTNIITIEKNIPIPGISHGVESKKYMF